MSERSRDPFSRLPVAAHLDCIQRALRERGVAVLQAPPGSGKTSLVPPAVLELDATGLVLVLQPRRVATRAVARMLAKRLETSVGGGVGYQVRFDTRRSDETRLLVLTEGVLTSWLQRDPALEGVTAVILDEFHERSLQADLALAMLKEVRETLRPELKVMVMSATLDAAPVAAFLGDAPVIECEVSNHPLTFSYSSVQDTRTLEVRVVEAIMELSAEMQAGITPRGHILVFLPGVRDIRDAKARLARLAPELSAVELHGRLTGEQQDDVLRPSAEHRVILSTNIAQTSLTIEGVTGVVDSGLAKQSELDPQTGLTRLVLIKISKAAAIQRAGRAGRLGPGRVMRLWSEVEEVRRSEFDSPEVSRQDLTDLVLDLKAWGAVDAGRFDFFEAPPPPNLRRASELLERLGAIEGPQGKLTQTGKMMRMIPAHPRIARMLVEASRLGVRYEAAEVAALLLEGPNTVPHMSNDVGDADVLCWRQVEVQRGSFRRGRPLGRLTHRLADGAKARGIGEHIGSKLCRCLFVGWPDQLSRREVLTDPVLTLVGGRKARLAPQSVVRDASLMTALSSSRDRGGDLVVRSAAFVEQRWVEGHPGFRSSEVLVWEPDRLRVAAYYERSFYGLRLSRQPAPLTEGPAVAELLAETMATRLDQRFMTEPAVASLVRRIELLAELQPELDLPSDMRHWFRSAHSRFCTGCRSWAEVKQRDLAEFVLSSLSWRHREALNQEAPAKLKVPSGRMVALSYPADGPPILAVKVQEVFGWMTCPTIARGRCTVVLHLLDPARRPLQVTQDLASFWTGTWLEVCKEMRRRYPKHRWPDDPGQALPSLKTTKRR